MPDPQAETLAARALERFRRQADIWERHIHAFVEISAVDDVQSAQGPLSGLSVGVKDIIDVAGLATRNGSDACRDARPADADAVVVAALRRAGASIVGKTTTTEFAFTDPTPCRNPFDLTRTPGGSSSGSGAAVAAGLVDIALGTQTAGSLCRPAAYCGVVGFKPSYGVLSTRGVTPLSTSFDSVGVIAGSVALAGAAFSAMAPIPVPAQDTHDVRLAVGLWDTSITPQDEALAALHDAARISAGLGLGAGTTALTADVDAIVAAHRMVMTHDAAKAHGAMLSDQRSNLLKPKFLAGLRAGAEVPSEQARQSAGYLGAAQKVFWAGLGATDVVLTLPVPDGAPLIDGTTGFQDWLTPWTVFGGPLVCLPWGLDRSGRPQSVMLAARPGQDALVLSVAGRLERHGPPRPLPVPPAG